MYPLVDFLHEIWSHNAILFGFYNIMMLAIIGEMHSAQDKDSSGTKKIDAPERPSEPSGKQTHTGSTLLLLVIRWVWPALMGLSFAIFSAETGTTKLTATFFAAMLCACVYIKQQLHLDYMKLFNDLIVLGAFTKASAIGFVTLYLY